MTRTTELELSATYQNNVGSLVSREVGHCVSHLISNLMQMPGADMEEHFDDLMSICSQPDYDQGAENAGWTEYKDEFGVTCWKDESDGQTWACATAQELCRDFDIDPEEYTEALEHWIVSDWLADKLEEHGEMVCKDIHGLTIWGRTCSGQAILLDRVICDIYDKLHADDTPTPNEPPKKQSYIVESSNGSGGVDRVNHGTSRAGAISNAKHIAERDQVYVFVISEERQTVAQFDCDGELQAE